MSDQTPDAGGSPTLTRAVRTMPGWKVGLLVVSLIVGVLGAGAYFTARNLNQGKTVTVQQTVPAHPGTTGQSAVPGSGFMGSGDAAPDAPQTTTTTTTVAAPPSLTEQYAPVLAKVGFSFFVGLIVGTISRTFLKLTALVGVLIVGLVAAAHYFNIDLNLSGVQAQANQASTWVQGQMMQLWGTIKTHLPSAGSATAGFVFGMKRR